MAQETKVCSDCKRECLEWEEKCDCGAAFPEETNAMKPQFPRHLWLAVPYVVMGVLMFAYYLIDWLIS